MTDNTTLQSQYAAQVDSDLERNAKETERIAAEVTALQEQLQNLQHDRALLVGLRQTLVGEAVPGEGAAGGEGDTKAADGGSTAPAAALPKARKPKDAAPASGQAAGKTAKKTTKKQAGARKATAKKAATKKTAAKKTATKKTATKKQASSEAKPTGAPTLRELVAAHLGGHAEPLSAAEITTGLTAAHPDRKFGATVVRNTLEALVAKGQAQRSRQNRSVFYTVADAGAPAEGATDKNASANGSDAADAGAEDKKSKVLSAE